MKTTGVKRLRSILKSYEAEGTTKQCSLRDLLTDIRHYCEAKRLDFYRAVDGSYDVYCDERHEDRQMAGKQL